MASSLPNTPEAGRGERHGWNSLDDYLWQHERRLENYSSFVENFKFAFETYPIDDESLLRLDMEILCKGGIKLTVEKSAQVRGKRRKLAKTLSYSYNASTSEGNILRYDNAHKHAGHPTEHHKHIFNSNGHEVQGSPFPIEEDNWPHMHQVVEELFARFPPTGTSL